MCLKTTVVVVILAGILPRGQREATADTADTLELLQVIVRHGNRTSPSIFTQFIPEYVKNFHPFEFDQLTPQGRKQIANVGEFLRDRYHDFLPDEFSYESVAVNCTDFTRVVESAMVCMAALFPPKNLQKWNGSSLGQIWTPITCRSTPLSQDVVLSPATVNCPRLVQLQNNLLTSPEFITRYEILIKNGSVVEYIQNSLNMSTSEPLSRFNVINVWENLYLLESLQKPLPEWSKAVYPSPLTEINHMGLWSNYITSDLVMFSVGEYLREILYIAQALEYKELRPLNRKMFISFAHDLNIMPLLVALKLETDPVQPGYGAAFIMEMHRIPETQEIGFKFVYRNVTWQDPTVYIVPGCEEICPLRFVRQVVQQYIPTMSFEELCYVDID